MNDQQLEVEKLYTKFENETFEKITTDKASYKLYESGQPRNFIKNILTNIINFASMRLDTEYQIQLYSRLASDLFGFNEYNLALECYELISQKCENINDELISTKTIVESLQNIVRSNYAEIIQLKTAYIAPMVVSKLLVCLQELRGSFDNIFNLSVKQQESFAWMVLNSCKLIIEIGQPLVWYSCGKYVIETMMFAVVSMEAIINLCTVRHMKFRMKIYSTLFYATLANGVTDQAYAILEHTRKQANQLKEREELDPPVPITSINCIQRCTVDLAVMKFTLDYWKDPESFNLSDINLDKYFTSPSSTTTTTTTGSTELWAKRSFADLCASECIRVHLLTAGNANEVFRKRSSSIAKGIALEFQAYISTMQSEEISTSTMEASDKVKLVLLQKYSMRFLLEAMILFSFNSLDGVNVSTNLFKLASLGEDLYNQQKESNANVIDEHAYQCLKLLLSTHQLSICNSKGDTRIGLVTEVILQIQAIIYSESAYRSTTFLKKTVLDMWIKHLYPTIQESLSNLRNVIGDAENSLKLLKEISPGLVASVKVFDISSLEDPILMGTIALLCAQVLSELGDLRGCLSLVHQAICTINEHRAARVDILQHIPEDVRDIQALQRGSFTTRSDYTDWFHSVKRLGAHAFAGYGIFGLASSADRGDQAMAEIHSELVAFYIRKEIEYSIQQVNRKHNVRKRLEKEEEMRTARAKALLLGTVKKINKKEKIKPPTATERLTSGGALIMGKTGTLNLQSDQSVNVQSLPVIASLKSFCSKNAYYRCILLLEMARCDDDRDRKIEYLAEAYTAIEECEGKEQLLKESFVDLLVMTETDRKYPLVIARSHHYIYVAPVGYRKIKKATYYRILAKEKGSGTGISIHNDDLGGCEKRVYPDQLNNLKNSVVRIGPLREGEHYVFGSAAYNEANKVVNGVSSTSPAVDAVNPLPTILLWNWLTQLVEQIGYNPLHNDVSLRVADRYFMKTPKLETRVVGHGLNLFIFNEPSLCMLAVQQSSPVLMHSLIDSCVSYEALLQRLNVQHCQDNIEIHWFRQCPQQLSGLTTLHRTALVSTIACGMQNHDLTLRCIKIGCDAAFEMIRFDIVHLSQYLQNPITVLILSLQIIPKRNWNNLEHKLYTKLLSHLSKIANMNKNITPAINVLNFFYPEVLSADQNLANSSRPLLKYLDDYVGLLITVQECFAPEHLTVFLQQIEKLFIPLTIEKYSEVQNENTVSSSTKVGYLWSMTSIQRRLRVTNCGLTLLKPPEDKAPADRLQLEKWILLEKPLNMSDYLNMLVQLAKEVSKSIPVTTGSSSTAIFQLIERLPICKEYLSPRASELSDAWRIGLLQPLEMFAKGLVNKKQVLSPRNAVKGGKPTPGVTEPDEATILNEASIIPERYSKVELEEERAQLKSLGELLYLLTMNSNIGGGKVTNHFPKSSEGPNIYIDPVPFNQNQSMNFNEELSNLNIVDITENNIFVPLSAAGYIKLLGCALDMLREAEAPYAAIQVACTIWRFIASEWIDPISFSIEFSKIKIYNLMILKSCVSLMESMSFATEFEQIDSENSTNEQQLIDKNDDVLISDDYSWSYQREVKENSLILRSLVVYLLKVEWIHGKHLLDVVQLGSRVFKTMLINTPEYIKNYGDHCLPLIMNAQERLIEAAKEFVVLKQSELENFIFQYEEAQRKKRTKKLRIARLEKTEEELLFEAERSEYEEKVNNAKSALESSYQQMIEIKSQQKKFDKLYSSGSLALDKVRLLTRSFIIKTKSTYGANANFANILNINSELNESLHNLIQQFSPVVSILRQKKEKVLLVEALKLQGDLLLFFQLTAQARSIWNDAVDGLFNVMDACNDWKTVSDNAIASLEIELLPGILPIVVALSKLSRFCASNDLDMKARYARMAANLCRIPFQESYGHPQTIVGFAAYECVELGGVFSLALRSEALSSSDLAFGLQEIIVTLISEKQYIVALPVVVLLEHLYAIYVSNASLWLSARLLRIRILIESHLFAEAASMFASIRFMITNIHNFSYADVLRNRFCESNKELTTFNTSENGLNFYGYSPYFNNLPPDDVKINMLALKWITSYATEFETFAKSFKIDLPIIPLTTEEMAAEAERKVKIEEEASLAAKKGKGGKVPAKVEVIDSTGNDKSSQPLFPILQIAELYLVIATFLIEISMLDSSSTTTPAKVLQNISNQGLDSLSRAKTLLYSLFDSKSLNNIENTNTEELIMKEINVVKSKDWLRIYSGIEILRNTQRIHVRKYKQVRASCMDMICLLKNEHFNTGLCGDTRNVLAQLWFSTRSLMLIVADCQARFNDVLTISKESIEESSMLLCGHWLRNYLFHRAKAQYKLGNLSDSIRDIKACISQYEQNKLEDLQLIRCLCLQASLIRENNLYSSKSQCTQAFIDSIALIRKSVNIANNLAKQSGAFPCDTNATYNRSDTAIKQYHMITPILQSLTELHENEPDLSLKPKFDSKKLQIHLGISFPSLLNNNKPSDEEKNQDINDDHTLIYKLDHLRLSPLDRVEGKYIETEYVNINLFENRILLTCQSLLCQEIDDARNAGLIKNNEFTKYYTIDALINEQLTLSEQSAKLIRHCVYLPIDIRVATLVYQAKARIAKKSKFEGKPEEYLATLIEPLTVALEIAINVHATHLWPLLRTACVELVELYGDHELDLGEQVASSRLKIAVVYLVGAIKISNQYTTITKNSHGISIDSSFDTNPSEELLHLVTNLSSSSATPDIDELRRKAIEEASAPVVTGKGAKAPPKVKSGNTATTSELVPNGRDALYLLSSLVREQDPLWLGSTEQVLCRDIHSLLRSSYPIYTSKCSLEQIPDPNASIDVVQGSVSCLWIPHKMPNTFNNILEKQPNEMDYNKTGFCSHLSVFFLFGDALSNLSPNTSTSNSNEPILTKIVLPRPDVVYIEKLLRNIRDRIIDAEMKSNLSIVESSRYDFGKAVCTLIGLLKQGVIVDDKLNINIKKEVTDSKDIANSNGKDSFEVIQSKGTAPNTTNYALNLSIYSEGKPSAIKTSMSINQQSILNLANICCFDRDTLLLKDNEICRLLRLALGYKVPYN